MDDATSRKEILYRAEAVSLLKAARYPDFSRDEKERGYNAAISDAVRIVVNCSFVPEVEPKRLKGAVFLRDVKERFDERYGDGWLFDYSEPESIEAIGSWLDRASARALWVTLQNIEAEQRGDCLTGAWVDDGTGKLACSVCGMKREISELQGECVSCGARMDGEAGCGNI